MTMKSLLGCAAIAALLLPATQANAARDYVWAAGSSTVFPFATRVAEQFARKSGGKAPKIESLGTGGGIKLFCGGATDAFPDIANASRPMKKSEVYGPPPSSGTRDAFVELAIEAGARKFPTAEAIRSDNEAKFKSIVDPLRKDGWIDAGENDNAVVQTLTKTPGSLGVFGYSYLEENQDKVKGSSVGGVKPTPGAIADGSYPLSRSLYIYVKKSRLATTQNLQQFVDEFVSDAATGKGGYLQQRGLIPLPGGQHDGNKAAAKAMPLMARPAS
jgi:phosphate transport system substrate-binding protein